MKLSLSQGQINQLFTMTLSFGSDLTVLESSPTLKKFCPAAEAGAGLLDLFDIHRPRGTYTFEAVCERSEHLFLLIAKDRSFALRGQVVIQQDDASKWAMFLGSPWMSWLSEHNPDLKLLMSDYPRHDSQLEHQFYVTTQQAMVRDLEQVNQEARAARDEAERARQIQSDFFAVMSHEMRTPLNGVISALSLIEENPAAPQKGELLTIAHTSARNLLSVINYVLDFSKLQAGKLKAEEEDFDLITTLKSAIDIVQPRADLKNLDIRLHVAPGCPKQILADGSKLRQVFLNLLSNAVKFTDSGRVEVRVHASEAGAEDLFELQIDVEDSGVGISKEQSPYIFDAFWTSRERTGRGEANTGLGLNICRRLIDLMGGVLDYSSEMGRGTCFTIKVPVHLSRTVSVQNAEPEAIPLLERVGRILLVDDNQTNLVVGRLMLERMGLDVEVASDGEEAIEQSARQCFDAILMDITMPGMDGMEATRRIRQRGDGMPVIALTAHVNLGRDQQYLDSGMQDVIHKPIDKRELVSALNRWLPATPSDATQELEEESAQGMHLESPGAAAAPADDEAVWIDQAIMEELIGDIGAENFSGALEVLIPETERRMAVVFASFDVGDLEQLAAEAHTVSSSVSSFGARRFGQTMRELEHAAEAPDPSRVKELMEVARHEYSHSLKALKALI